MEPISLLGIAVCITGLVTLCSAQSMMGKAVTSGTCFLPTIPKNGNYSSPSCPYVHQMACEGRAGFPVREYWVLSFTCNEGYSLENGLDSTLVHCINGIWYPSIPKCQKVCGKKHPCPSITEYPWHVGLYQFFYGGWTFYCLGTLISSHIVLTAADCVYDDDRQSAIGPSEVKVAIGKRNVMWSHNEPDSVKADVREISVPPQYVGEKTNYAHNIALLNLDGSVNITSIVMPACFDWDRELAISPGNRGTVTGWSGKSSFFNDTHLAYIDYRQCVSDVPADDAGLVQPEKLCAEHRDGPPLTSHYQGAGLTFVKNGAHYVFGVTSSIITKDRYLTIGVFTNVTNCQLWDWITETKEKFDTPSL